MTKIYFLFALFLMTTAAITCVPVGQEGSLGVEAFEELVDQEGRKMTCDLKKTTANSHCMEECIFTGGARFGYCKNGTCVCREITNREINNNRFDGNFTQFRPSDFRSYI